MDIVNLLNICECKQMYNSNNKQHDPDSNGLLFFLINAVESLCGIQNKDYLQFENWWYSVLCTQNNLKYTDVMITPDFCQYSRLKLFYLPDVMITPDFRKYPVHLPSFDNWFVSHV